MHSMGDFRAAALRHKHMHEEDRKFSHVARGMVNLGPGSEDIRDMLIQSYISISSFAARACRISTAPCSMTEQQTFG